MYFIVLLLLSIFGIIEICSRKSNKIVFLFCYVLMTLMAVFRYGQLTDYFNYELNYEYPEAALRDPLFAYLLVICNDHGVKYEVFSMMMDILIMLLSYPFFSRSCKKSIVALLIYYSYIFLLFPMSGIRQGLCISLMLYGFTCLIEKRKILFCLLTLISGFFHFSMFIVFLIILLYDKKFYNSDKWWLIIIGLTMFALVTPDLSSYIPEFFEGKSFGEYEDSRWVQMLLRFSILLPVMIIKPPYGTMGYYAKAICIVGYCMYCVFAFSSLIAGRLEFYFRIFTSLFASYLLFFATREKRLLKSCMLSMLLLIHCVLYFKNINSLIGQGGYNEEKVSAITFPYVSIFDKEELSRYK